MTSIKANDTS